LPLRIVSFGGLLQNDIAKLNWKIENEQEVQHYLVERSTDAVTFETIQQVKALNSNVSSYTYNDNLKNYRYDVVYYRIRQVNKNGEIFYSNVISFKKDAIETVKVKVYPNPVGARLMMTVSSPVKQSSKAFIFDAAGKLVIEKSIELEKGENSFRFEEVGRLVKGWYLIKVNIGDYTFVQKLIKE
jgi:hypothetical protein